MRTKETPEEESTKHRAETHHNQACCACLQVPQNISPVLAFLFSPPSRQPYQQNQEALAHIREDEPEYQRKGEEQNLCWVQVMPGRGAVGLDHLFCRVHYLGVGKACW